MKPLRPARITLYVAVALLAVIILYPIYILFLVAFSPAHFTLDALYPPQLPHAFTLQNLTTALQSYNLIDPLFQSLQVAFLVAFIALGLGIPAAYGLSRLPPGLAYGITTVLFVANILPALTIVVPIAAEFISLGLYDTAVGLALLQELVVLPLAVFILLGAFQSIPREIEYQARVDGAGLARTLFGTLVPLAKAGIIAAFLLSWMFSWDEFTFAVILVPIHPTLPVVIYDNITRGNLLATTAFAIVMTIPVVLLTVVLQKYLKGEELAGGLKG